ncbi:MAG: murein biosynthesis integral membrane protein MurJ [Dehalococcoidia bacterium]
MRPHDTPPSEPSDPDAPDPAEGPRRDRAGRLRRYLVGNAGTYEARATRRGVRSVLMNAAMIVAAGFLLSRVLGLLRSVAIAHAFGTDPELSAYWVAFRLPDLVFQLLAGATLSAAFIPTFSRERMERGEAAAWRLASSVLHLISIATAVAAAAAFFLAPVIVPWLAPGLGEATGREDELMAQAVSLTRLMLLSPLFFGVSGMLTGILNGRQHFIAPAIAPLIYNLGIIAGALLLAEPLGVYGLAWGVVAGSAGHLLVQVPALARVGMRWTPALDWRGPGVREVLRLMGPRIVGLAAAQVNFIALMFFASFVSDEAISAMNYAFLLVMLPVGVIGMAISTAVFPTLAEQAAARQTARLRRAITRALRVILLLAIPASAGLALLAEPVVRLLLERGAFDEPATQLVAGVLVVYAFGVFALSGVEIVSRGFYALADTRTPVAAAVVTMVLNVALAALLVGPFGLRGLAAAAATAAALEFGLLLWALHRRIGGLDARGLRRSVTSTVLATLVMTAVVLGTRWALAQAGLAAETTMTALAVLAMCGGAGALVFLLTSYLINRDDYTALGEGLGR